MATRRKRRELRCTCGGPLRIGRTVYQENSVVRYRYCALCRAPYKSIEKLVSDFSPRRSVARVARAIQRLMMKEKNHE